VGLDDIDGDCVPNDSDNCPDIPNGPLEVAKECHGNQPDSDGDGLGDACDDDWTQMLFTDRELFSCNTDDFLVDLLDFDAMSANASLSNVTVSLPLTDTELTFPPPLPNLPNPGGPALDLIVLEDQGGNPSLSGLNSLGVDDPTNDHSIAAGSTLHFSFDQPMNGFALHVISSGQQGVDLFGGDVALTLGGGPTIALGTQSGQLVANISGKDYYAYFLGGLTTTPFTTADLSSNQGGTFFFTMDDMSAVPEASPLALLCAGWAGLALLARRRRASRPRTSSEG